MVLLGFLLAALVALAAYRARALSLSGAVAACGVGTVALGVGGWLPAAALLLFFASSTALSRWRRAAKAELGYEKGGRRDAGQVLANGGVAVACLLLPLAFPTVSVPHAHVLFLAALAAANADTWGTEIGSALGGQPYDLRTGRPAPPGTSGAVSLKGTLAVLAGATCLGLLAPDWRSRVIVTLAGLGGALADSILGATCQAQWRDPDRPGRWTERPRSSPPDRGWRGVDNDAVNFFCTLLGVCLAALLLQK